VGTINTLGDAPNCKQVVEGIIGKKQLQQSSDGFPEIRVQSSSSNIWNTERERERERERYLEGVANVEDERIG